MLSVAGSHDSDTVEGPVAVATRFDGADGGVVSDDTDTGTTASNVTVCDADDVEDADNGPVAPAAACAFVAISSSSPAGSNCSVNPDGGDHSEELRTVAPNTSSRSPAAVVADSVGVTVP